MEAKVDTKYALHIGDVLHYKQKCPKCGGKGWKVNHVVGLGTLGLGYLVQAVSGKLSSDEDCPMCKGTGCIIVERKVEPMVLDLSGLKE